ncbi:MAG: GNAT family protein [Paludibacter sp.]|nr:GNAT family protein [Paludibacter sp.]
MQNKQLIVDDEIILQEIGQDEVKPIFETIHAERKYLGEWLPFVDYTLELSDTQNFIDNLVVNETKDLTFAIYYHNKFVGLVGLKDPDYDNRKIEIGYWVAEQYQHKGIITNSCRKLIEYAFNELDFNRIQLKSATQNLKSQFVAKRLGFKKEGIERDGELHKRGYVDLIVYSLLKKDLEKKSRGFERLYYVSVQPYQRLKTLTAVEKHISFAFEPTFQLTN